MAIYLIMKSNLKRVFATKFTYMVMILIPVAISFISILSDSISNPKIRVGVIGNAEEFAEITDFFLMYPSIYCETAEAETMHTDVITGKYQYLIDMTADNKNSIKESLLAIITAENQTQGSRTVGMAQTDRKFALLLTAYMMIASMYAAIMIRDKKNGTMERFCVAGFKNHTYHLGFFISTGLVMLCQLSLAVLIFALFDRSFSVSFGRALEMIVFMAAVASAFGVGVASILKSELHANITASSTVAILSLLGGTFVPIGQMPELFKFISIISPIRWLQLLP
jgi:ABC-2 type transporter